MDAKQTSFVIKIDATQAAVLERLLRERGWAFAEAPYARWRAAGDKVQIVIEEEAPGRRKEGCVIKVLERANKEVVGL